MTSSFPTIAPAMFRWRRANAVSKDVSSCDSSRSRQGCQPASLATDLLLNDLDLRDADEASRFLSPG
jgi:hypothetical protein